MKAITRKIPMFFHEFKGMPIPNIDLDSYRLIVEGEVSNRLELSLAELEELVPLVDSDRRFYCVNGWSLVRSMARLRSRSGVGACWSFASRGFCGQRVWEAYEDTSRIEDLIGGGAMLITHMDGERLSPKRGRPMRLMIFDKYQFRGVKALATIEIVNEYRPGAWVKYGYTDATIQPFAHFAVDKDEDLSQSRTSWVWPQTSSRNASVPKAGRQKGLCHYAI